MHASSSWPKIEYNSPLFLLNRLFSKCYPCEMRKFEAPAEKLPLALINVDRRYKNVNRARLRTHWNVPDCTTELARSTFWGQRQGRTPEDDEAFIWLRISAQKNESDSGADLEITFTITDYVRICKAKDRNTKAKRKLCASSSLSVPSPKHL